MITDDERKAITELLQSGGFTAAQIERIMEVREEAKTIKKENDENNSWVSSEELWAMLIDRYGEPYKSKYAELQIRRATLHKDSESQ